jgi:hypothetical protein
MERFRRECAEYLAGAHGRPREKRIPPWRDRREGNNSRLAWLADHDAPFDLPSGMDHPTSMRLSLWTTPLLVALAASLPSLTTLCELHCASPVSVTKTVSGATESPACPGHAPKNAGKAPGNPARSEPDHDCGGHRLLAKGGASFETRLGGVSVGLAMTTETPTSRVTPTDGAASSASPDLSPPFGRSSDILRL